MCKNILFVTPYIFSQRHPHFLRNQTGFGYMVHDIAECVGKLNNVDLYAAMCFAPSIEMENFHIIGRSWWKTITSISFKSIADGFSFLRRYKLPISEQLRTMYIFIATGQIARMVKNYDMVHVHGCSALTDAVIKVCKRKNVPFLVTLHGLNSFSEGIKLHPSLKQYERDFIKEAAEKHYPVSFISTGNKNMAIESAGTVIDSFHVVCNGCDTTCSQADENIRSLYNIQSDDFVFVFVGNISQNKNQYQVARAWKLLPEEKKQKCKVLFVGRYQADDDVVKFIQKEHLEKQLILCGMQPKDKIHTFYYAADATILTSITEGFGLSIIEGFVYGKPNVTFADLPAVQDLFDANAMVLAEARSDEVLAQAMVKVMEMQIDEKEILKYAQKFSFARMAENYHELYQKVVK